MMLYVKLVKNLVGKHQQKFNVNHYQLLFKVNKFLINDDDDDDDYF